MSPAAISVLVFGVYILGQGALLFFAPDLLLGLLGLPPAADGWVRVVGLALGVLGVYYVWAARTELRAFFAMTVPVRLAQFVAFGWLVWAGHLSAIVLATSAVEALAGLWTWAALRAGRG